MATGKCVEKVDQPNAIAQAQLLEYTSLNDYIHCSCPNEAWLAVGTTLIPEVTVMELGPAYWAAQRHTGFLAHHEDFLPQTAHLDATRSAHNGRRLQKLPEVAKVERSALRGRTTVATPKEPPHKSSCKQEETDSRLRDIAGTGISTWHESFDRIHRWLLETNAEIRVVIEPGGSVQHLCISLQVVTSWQRDMLLFGQKKRTSDGSCRDAAGAWTRKSWWGFDVQWPDEDLDDLEVESIVLATSKPKRSPNLIDLGRTLLQTSADY